MMKNVLDDCKDPMGAAIYDYYKNGKAGKLRVFSPDFDEDEIPVKELFRDFGQMSQIEQLALRRAQGQILDVGAGSGCHSLALKELGKNSKAIDISGLAVEVMRQRGVDASVTDFFDPSFTGTFDTIIMLMNGAGIIGNIDNIGNFFERVDKLLNDGGVVLMDSSDLKYLYEDEQGGYVFNLAGDYYGQMKYSMKYKNIQGEPFDWLYIDFDTLSYYARKYGYNVVLLHEGEHYDFLVELSCI